MTRRVYVDTDVILDLLLAREPFFAAATRFFLLLQERQVEAFTTPVVFSNLFHTKPYRSARHRPAINHRATSERPLKAASNSMLRNLVSEGPTSRA